MFRRHGARLVSVILMVLVSIGFSAGIGMATDKMDYALDDIYRGSNMSDLIVKSTRKTGFTEDELALLKDRYKNNLAIGASFEFENAGMESESAQGPMTVRTEMAFTGVGEGITKVYFFDMPPADYTQNTVKLLDSIERPQELDETYIGVWAERETSQLLPYELGAVLSASVTVSVTGAPVPIPPQTTEYKFFVEGIVENPLHIAERRDVSMQFEDENGKQRELESIFYLADGALMPPAGDAYIKIGCPEKTLVMSRDYESMIGVEKLALEELLQIDGELNAKVLTLFENFTMSSFHAYSDKITSIGYVMVVVFLLVTLLVVLSTMTRLLEEERSQIACLSTLGYSPAKIISKYLLFALVGTVIGAVGGYGAGMGLAYIVYINFRWNYTIPPFPARSSNVFFLIVTAVILLSTLLATLIAGFRMTRERPAALLRPKAPKLGKKVILERIPVLWNRFSFKYKSTLRNVLRYKLRFFMTVIAVMASTALVLAGLAVLDCCLFQDIGTTAMIVVGIVVVFFAALLNFVVIYTLTNINISERSRELATLMVLGYHDKEVAGYVYREIYITSAIGIALGLLLGALLCVFIFSLMVLGSLSAVNWFVWIITPLLSLLFTYLVTLMLHGKIVKIDMNESLKAIE